MRSYVVAFLAPLVGRPVALALAPTYFTMAALAGLVAGALVVRDARRRSEPVPVVLSALLWGYACALGCGILVPIAVDLAQQALAGHVPRLRWAGIVAYAGFAGGLGAAALVVRKSGALTVARFADLVAAPLGVAIALVRVGCFLGGCDYGQVTSLPWAVRFPAGSPAFVDHVQAGLVPAARAASLPVHPTQLYEALLGLALFAGASWLGRRRREWPAGALFLVVAVGYAVGRSAIELLRGDASRGLFGPFSTSQLLSLAVVCLALPSLKRRLRVAAVAVVLLLASIPDARAQAGGFDAGALVGSTNPFNRHEDQVPQLAGFGLFGTYALSPTSGVGLDIDWMVNAVARHTTILASFATRGPIRPNIFVGFRGGIGFTTVDFEDPSFAAFTGFDARAAATVDWKVSDRFLLTVWPVGFDYLTAAQTGGPILSYEFRAGVTLLFPPSAPAPAPAPAPPPAPPPQQQPPPQPSEPMK